MIDLLRFRPCPHIKGAMLGNVNHNQSGQDLWAHAHNLSRAPAIAADGSPTAPPDAARKPASSPVAQRDGSPEAVRSRMASLPKTARQPHFSNLRLSGR